MSEAKNYQTLFSVSPVPRGRSNTISIMERAGDRGEPRGFLEYIEEPAAPKRAPAAPKRAPAAPPAALTRKSSYEMHPFWADASQGERLECVRLSLRLADARGLDGVSYKECALLSFVKLRSSGLFRTRGENYVGAPLFSLIEAFPAAVNRLARMVAENPTDCMVRVCKPLITRPRSRSTGALSSESSLSLFRDSEWHDHTVSEDDGMSDSSSSAHVSHSGRMFWDSSERTSTEERSSASLRAVLTHFSRSSSSLATTSTLSSGDLTAFNGTTFNDFVFATPAGQKHLHFFELLSKWKENPSENLLRSIVESYVTSEPAFLNVEAERKALQKQLHVAADEAEPLDNMVTSSDPQLFTQLEQAVYKQLSLKAMSAYLSVLFEEAARQEDALLLPANCFDGFISCVMDISPAWVLTGESIDSRIRMWEFDSAAASEEHSLVNDRMAVIKASTTVSTSPQQTVEWLTRLDSRLKLDPNFCHFEELKRFSSEFTALYGIADTHLLGARKRDFVMGRIVKKFPSKNNLWCIVDHGINNLPDAPKKSSKYVRGTIHMSGWVILPLARGSEVFWINQVATNGHVSVQQTKKIIQERGFAYLRNLHEATRTST